MRRQECGDQLVHHVHRDIESGQECEEQHRHPERRITVKEPRQQQQQRERRDRAADDPADEHDVGMPQRATVPALTPLDAIPEFRFEAGDAGVDEVIADVCLALVGGLEERERHAARTIERVLRHFNFREARALGHALDHVPVLVARRETHAAVEARRVLAEHAIHRALALDEDLPVTQPDRPQARDAVRHHQRGQREPFGSALRRVVGRQPLIGDPPLEPEQRREPARRQPELLQEPRDEGRRERLPLAHERRKHVLERVGVLLALRLDARRPYVRRFHFAQAVHRAQRHPPHALDEPEPQHRRDRPELADRERRALLVRRHEEVDVIQRDATFGVRDQRGRYLVHARISAQRARPEFREFVVIVARETLAHLAHMLLHHVVVVEQPIARGTDVRAGRHRRAQPCVRIRDDVARIIQAREQPCLTGARRRFREPLPTRHRAGAPRQVPGAEQLATQGTRHQFFRRDRRSAR